MFNVLTANFLPICSDYISISFMIPENVIRKIEAIIGPERLLTSHEDCWAYDATD
jgi:hypothetical protein